MQVAANGRRRDLLPSSFGALVGAVMLIVCIVQNIRGQEPSPTLAYVGAGLLLGVPLAKILDRDSEK